MCYEAITCPNCSSLNIVKNGKTGQRKQRYLCKDCRRQFIRDYTCLGCVGAVRALIVPLTMNGSGLHDISRVLLLSLYTVLKTLRQAAEEVSEPAVPRRVRDLEVDEFWPFVGDKKQRRWTWYGFDRQRRKVIASVNDRRTDAACGRLLKKLEGCQVSRYHTDGWQSYKKLLPARKHNVGKEGTQCLEQSLACLFVIGLATDAYAVEPLLSHPDEAIRKAARTCMFEIRQRVTDGRD
jgi:IS1 family transposase/transposase-like protein